MGDTALVYWNIDLVFVSILGVVNHYSLHDNIERADNEMGANLVNIYK